MRFFQEWLPVEMTLPAKADLLFRPVDVYVEGRHISDRPEQGNPLKGSRRNPERVYELEYFWAGGILRGRNSTVAQARHIRCHHRYEDEFPKGRLGGRDDVVEKVPLERVAGIP